jgi:hypothetical protein
MRPSPSARLDDLPAGIRQQLLVEIGGALSGFQDAVRPVQLLSAHAHNIATPIQRLAVEGTSSGIGCQNCARFEIQQQLRNVALVEQLCPPLLNFQRMLQFGDSPLEFFVLRLQLRYQHFAHESLLRLIVFPTDLIGLLF